MRSTIIFCLLLAALLSLPVDSWSAEQVVDGESVVEYVLKCRKANGAFGPADQEYTDAAWNFPAVRTLRLLGVRIEDHAAILRHGIGSPMGHVGCGHWHFFHQHGIQQLLGGSPTAKHERVRLTFQGYKVRYYGSPFGTESDDFFQAGGPGLDPRDDTAEQLGFYNLSSLHYTLAGLHASGRTAANADELAAFITKRQAPCGGFVDVRAEGAQPADDEAHIAHTFHAVAALHQLDLRVPRAAACAEFIRLCQLPSGAFRWQPADDAPGNRADIYYTWAALRALHLLEQEPSHADLCMQWINSLQNNDGGFGDRPGWRSRLYSTYYAVEALKLLSPAGDVRTAVTQKRLPQPQLAHIPSIKFHIYQALFKTPLITADDLPKLQTRGFDLLAVKSADFAAGEELQRAARSLEPPMDVILCPEAYPHRARQIGGPLLHHAGNVTLNPSWQQPRRDIWQMADAAGEQGLAWPEYRRQVIGPLAQFGSRFYPEQDFELEFAYLVYDDGIRPVHGYNSVLAGFNWAPRDFVRVFPWRERYVDKLTPVSDADAHGDLVKWSPQLDHTRMLFLANEPTYEEFVAAADAGRVACVILDAPGVHSRTTYYGPPAVVEYVKQRVDQWKWWK